LRELAGRAGVLDIVTDAAAPLSVWEAALEKSGDEPVVILLDDGEALKDTPAAELFRGIIKRTGRDGQALVLGGNADGICTGLSGWQVEAKKARQGVLLSPQGTADGDLIGIRLPRSGVGSAIQPGRGLLHLGDGRLLTVATPVI
jgi:S-DNA-T family DNA segregation ATPase FtsK/SpoIIIE